jgi:hypothetical protein
MVELIPVMEIGCGNQGIEPPINHPPWQFPGEWNRFYEENFRKAGFGDPMPPLAGGLPFFRVTDIPAGNLRKLVGDHLQHYLTGEWTWEETCPFFGGYVLRIDGKDKLFPQCCGDLSDIGYWKRIANGTEVPWEGHPQPTVVFGEGTIRFICKDEWEAFYPDTEEVIEVDAKELRSAVSNAVLELCQFEATLRSINQEMRIVGIEKLLIYGEQTT